jgi:hypothetical protein
VIPPFFQPAAAKVEEGSVWPRQGIGAGPNSIPVFAALKVKIVDPLLLELLPDGAQVTAIVLRGNDSVVACCAVVRRLAGGVDAALDCNFTCKP